MKKKRIRDKMSHVHGTRFKVGNQRYLVRVWCGNRQVNLGDLFLNADINGALNILKKSNNLFKLKHSAFFDIITTFLPARFRKASPCSSFIHIHNCSANYTYVIMIEPNRIICFPKPVGYIINLKRRKARHYEET